MRNLLNPKWLLVINTLPIIILMLLFWSDFNIIKSLLGEENILLWKGFGSALFLIAIIHLGYTITCIIKKKTLSKYYAYISLIVYIVFIYIYSEYANKIIPWDIPDWMLSGNLLLYVGTFLMPTLAHSLFLIVIQFTPRNGDQKAWKNILGAVAIPIFCYIFFQIIIPSWHIFDYGFGTHVLTILLIICVILFLFFLIRGIYILTMKKEQVLKKYQLFWKIPITIIFPLLGLATNNGYIVRELGSINTGVFGDFSNHWFYVLAIVNGILLCLPNSSNVTYRFILFIGRSITFAYTFYFFIVFLPYLPLSVIAIIAIGLGFLMLTPLILFVIHIQEIVSDYSFLKPYFSKHILTITIVAGFLCIPSCITISYAKDRVVLHETLDYIYSPDYSKDYNIDRTSLAHTLSVIKHNKERNNDFLSSSRKPYLSKYFNWLVLDDLTLSDGKINAIERIFFNFESFGLRQDSSIGDDHVSISNIGSSSTYDEDKKQWTSWIDLEITNANTNTFFSEYATTINLPEGCWISDYYLFVGDRKEMGILAEKKSAMWVFSQIRQENRDPGLLHYLTGNKVSFRVFPFGEKEVRKTGIQFIHKAPVQIHIDGHDIQLGDLASTSANASIQNDVVAYVSSQEKEALELVQRQPYYHFVVDISEDTKQHVNTYISTIEKFLDTNPLATDHSISFSNAYTKTVALDDYWRTALKSQTFEGGFYLERAIKTILYNTQEQVSNRYPIIIAVTENMNRSIISKDFKDFRFAFPESNRFYHLNTLGYLAAHDLTNRPKQAVNDDDKVILNDSVLVWPNAKSPLAYLPNNDQADMVLKQVKPTLNDADIAPHDWTSALLLQAKFRSNILYPEQAEKDWTRMVRHSFMAKTMTPYTSYIVVENEAQKAILLKKQKDVLSGKMALDLNEDTQRMSEPELYLLLLLFGLFLLFKQKRAQRF